MYSDQSRRDRSIATNRECAGVEAAPSDYETRESQARGVTPPSGQEIRARSRTKPACKRSSCVSDMPSRSTPGVASGGRALCNQRRRISAARGSDTARSRKPRSMSASEGGSLLLRVARGADHSAARSPARTGVPPQASACLQARELLLARGLAVYLIGEHARQQNVKLLVRQRCKLQQAGVQPLQLAFRHESRSTPGVASGGRILCSQRSRISAARGSDTARSRKPRSMSASDGGSLLLRVARPGRGGTRGTPTVRGVPGLPADSGLETTIELDSCLQASSRSHRQRSCSHSPNRTAQKRAR